MLEVLWKKTCTHEHITPNMMAGYCPDCGEYVQNRWYISRCKCCGVKQKAIIRHGKVVTLNKYCKNCGSNFFAIEELKQINVIEINYAVVLKQAVETRRKSFIQSWVEQTNYSPIKLLPIY